MESGLGHLDGVVQGDHVGLIVDPQHRGRDVLS